MWSQKARYALRALLHLAEREGAGPVQLGELAQAQAIPPKYLEAIMVDLKRAGLVLSRRGRGGGHVLARDADTITFLEVMRAMDGPVALVPCASETSYARCGDCHDEATCVIRRVAARVREAAIAILDRTTLAGAAAKEEALAALSA